MNFWDFVEFGVVLGTIAILTLFPIGRILSRMGYSVWWLLIFVVPLGPIIGLWIIAFANWRIADANPKIGDA